MMDKKKDRWVIGAHGEVEGEKWQCARNDVGIRHEGSLRIAKIIETGSGQKQRDKRREYRVILALESLCYENAKSREEYTDPHQFKILLHRMAAEKAKRRRGRQWSDSAPEQHLPFLEFFGGGDAGTGSADPSPVAIKTEPGSDARLESSSAGLAQGMTALFTHGGAEADTAGGEKTEGGMSTIEEDKTLVFCDDRGPEPKPKPNLKVETQMDMSDATDSFVDEAKSGHPFPFSPFHLSMKQESGEFGGPANEQPAPSPCFAAGYAGAPSGALSPASLSSSRTDAVKRPKNRSKSDTHLPAFGSNELQQHSLPQDASLQQVQEASSRFSLRAGADQGDFLERQRTPRRRATTSLPHTEEFTQGWFNFFEQ